MFSTSASPLQSKIKFLRVTTTGPWPARNIGTILRMSLPAATVTATANPWLRILGALEKKITRHSYDTWLKPTRFSHINGNIIFVRVPNPEFRQLGEKFGDLI